MKMQPPPGYRLLSEDDVIEQGDMYLEKNGSWYYSASIGGSIGVLLYFKAALAYARKLPPKYRPFANDKEASDFIGVTLIGNEKATWAFADLNAVGDGSALIGDERIPFKKAFEEYSFTGGEPFGVREQ
jgi:hypothetical protein